LFWGSNGTSTFVTRETEGDGNDERKKGGESRTGLLSMAARRVDNRGI
jgi:hypothetical protein